jgi:aspartate aminotransferase/aminotransferase
MPNIADPARFLAARTAKIDASGIRKVFDLATKMTDPINLSIGQPDFDVPAPVAQAAKEAIDAGKNRYTVTQGDQALRDDIRRMLADTRGYEPEDLFIASGVSGALVLLMLATIEPGDEVLFGDPYFVMYKHLVNLVGGTPVVVDTYPDFNLSAARIAPAITERTKLLLINTPCNPTGAVIPEDELKAIAELCRSKGVLVASDEIYERFVYDGEFASLAPHCPEGILMGGFSKTYAMTGWRLAWAAGPKAIIQEMVKLQQYSFVCAPSFAQEAGRVALNVDVTEHIDDYRRKRDLMVEALSGTFELSPAGGAFYLFAKVPHGTGTEFAMKAIENNVLVIPGNVFSQHDTHIRICYTIDDEKLRQGADILTRIATG